MIKKKFKKISIKIASSSKIMNWSFGEVKITEFINYKNLKPEKNGLFCLNIFSNYDLCCEKKKCVCNRYDKYLNLKKAHISYKMGHIKLYYPVIHFWYMKSIPNNISNIVGISYKTIEKISNFKINIVVKSYSKKIKKKFLIIINRDYRIYTMSGAKAIKYLLTDNEIIIDCSLIKKQIEKCESFHKLFFFLERINKIYIFYVSGNKPSWLILSLIPVIPPRMRPLIPLSIEKFASSDINELYKRILNRNLRLKKLMKLGTPKQVLVNDRILLQESVYSLFDNEKLENPALSSSKRILKSFSSSIKGKYGRFRQNLLGKRVDFSGRTVITVDPNIFLFQCIIPISIALELFKPFLYYELKNQNLISTITFFDDYYKLNKKKIILILKKIVNNHTVILNRAPTLHRMGLQSFKILLSEDKTIKIHPLMCLSYNADFDGDQMAIHLPLTILSQIESEFLLLSTNNIISPSNGDPIIIPTQDIVMGVYYLSYNFNIKINKIFTLVNVISFYNKNYVNFKYSIYYLLNSILIRTTIGRVIFSLTLLNKVNFFSINKLIKKKTLTYIVKYLYEFCNLKELIIILEKIKKIGFYYSTYCGISINYYDLIDIKNKYYLKKIFNKLFKKKNIFKIIEMFNKVFLNIILKKIQTFKLSKKINNLFIMLDSGSRGTLLQIKQLLLFRGFISKSNGEIIIDPILENLKNGLSIKSYYISTFGARKGLTDTSLKTANSGYLTRKLIDVMHDLVIYKIDCYTNTGLEIFINNYNLIELYKKIFGRIILKNIIKKNKIIILRNTIICNKIIYLILKTKIDELHIRSSIYCNALRGVCSFCYGIDLSTLKLISVGSPIGIIAAQSIGEPGTQLTMRTFHTGGVASYSYTEENLVGMFSGFFKIKNCKCVLNFKNNLISVSLSPNIIIKKDNFLESYKLSYGDKIPFRNGVFIKCNIKLLKISDSSFFIYSENKGYIFFKNENLILEFCRNDKKFYYKTLKNTILHIKDLKKKKYIIPKNFFILYNNNDYILPGTKIAKTLNFEALHSNIIGGLPRLSELFESRIPNDKSIISEIDGIISVKINEKNYIIKIISKYGFYKLHNISFLRKLYVNNGDYVKMGDIISDGKLDLNDVIKYIGVEFLLSYFVNEINSIYLPQGIYINEKHLELVLKQMIKKINVLYSGECIFNQNDILFFEDVLVENYLTLKSNKKVCLYERLVMGITKVSLDSLSFFSAASFQETNKVLMDSAIRNRTDYLLGLKENVVVGKLIPAGTGLLYHFRNLNSKKKSDNNNNNVEKNNIKKNNIKKNNIKKNIKLYLY